ncbi:MAG: glycine zipper domain-containing protein [Pirellulales bacterium]|nr:glycine zipper domain-containing protein [Pirellulales bacterium]
MCKSISSFLLLATVCAAGCASPYYADRGAGLGALAGAGAGAIIGNQSGNAAEGALLGAALGGITGAAAGSAMDEIEARNRAEIAAHLGRELPPGGASVEDVIAMTRSGVPSSVIASHVRTVGMAREMQPNDYIRMNAEGVSEEVMQAAQQSRPQVAASSAPPVVYTSPPPVIVEEYWGPPGYYHRPYWGPRYRRPRRGGMNWGFSISK